MNVNIQILDNSALKDLLNLEEGENFLNLTQEALELLFDEAEEMFSGDEIRLSDRQKERIKEYADKILSEITEKNNDFNMFDSAKALAKLWRQNKDEEASAGIPKKASLNKRASDNKKTAANSNDGLNKIKTMKEEAAASQESNTVEIKQPAVQENTIKQDLAASLEGKTLEEKKTILNQTVQTQRENISSIQDGSNSAVQGAQEQMDTSEAQMNLAIDNDTNINEEVKAQIKESESAITAKSQEISAKEAEITAADASITECQNSISSLQNALSSLPAPSGQEGDEAKDAKLASRKSELESQISAKQAELAQLQAQKAQLEGEKGTLEGEKGELETQKTQIQEEELKDASPATKAAIAAYENARTNVEQTKTSELQKVQKNLDETLKQLDKVEAEIEKQKNASANTNFNINGTIDDFEQGQTGDCWLLSSLESLSNTKDGQKIIKDSIQINEDGTFTVKFDGIDHEVTLTENDLKAARQSGQYSNGDDDVLLMEVATQRILEQARNNEVQLDERDSMRLNSTITEGGANPLNSGTSIGLATLLSDKSDFEVAINGFDGNSNANVDELLNKIEENGDNSFATVAFAAGGSSSINSLNAGVVENGSNSTGGHLWSIKSVQGDKVTLVNPWHSNQEIVTTRAELAKSKIELTYQDLE